jgi:hypothetical protein
MVVKGSRLTVFASTDRHVRRRLNKSSEPSRNEMFESNSSGRSARGEHKESETVLRSIDDEEVEREDDGEREPFITSMASLAPGDMPAGRAGECVAMVVRSGMEDATKKWRKKRRPKLKSQNDSVCQC